MKSLADFIQYDQKQFSQITDENEMKMILDVAAKLQTLEEEILSHPNAGIYIRKSRAIYLDGFPDDLSKRIINLLKEAF